MLLGNKELLLNESDRVITHLKNLLTNDENLINQINDYIKSVHGK